MHSNSLDGKVLNEEDIIIIPYGITVYTKWNVEKITIYRIQYKLKKTICYKIYT